MKTFALLAIAQFGGGWVLYPPVSGAQQALTGEPSAALKSCITGNAASVEQAISSLDEGVNFLVQKACAAPLAEQLAAQQAEQQKKMADAQKARTDAMCKALETSKPQAAANDKDDETRLQASYFKQMCDPAMRALSDTGGLDYLSLYTARIGDNSTLAAPGATSLAAQTLLKLRVDRTNKRQ